MATKPTEPNYEFQDPRFDYSVYEEHNFLSRDELNKILKIVLEPGSSMWAKIVSGVQLLIILGILIAREKMYKEERRVGKQIYERKVTDDIKDDLGRDNLASEPRR